MNEPAEELPVEQPGCNHLGAPHKLLEFTETPSPLSGIVFL